MKSFESIVESLIHSGKLANPALNNLENWPHTLRTAASICFSSPEAMMIFWGREYLLFYNDACRPVFDNQDARFIMGQPAAEQLSKTWHTFEPVIREVIATNRPVEISGIVFTDCRDSKSICNHENYTCRLVPLQSADGKPEGVILFPVLEAGEEAPQLNVCRNQNLRNYCRSEHILNQLLKINTVGILFFDIAGNFLDANDTFLRMIGYTRRDLEAGKLSSELVSLPEWMPRTLQVFEELKSAEYFSPYEKELLRPDGSRWWGLFAGTRIGDNEFVEFVLDITEKKHVELALGRAKHAAEKALKAKDEFLSVMSHELRTPLSAIIGLSNLLLKNNARHDQLKNLTALQISSRNMLHLINEILDFSKAEAGKLNVNPEEFSMRDFLSDVKNIHQVNALDKKIDFYVKAADGFPDQIVTDKVKLSRVLDNLLNNAIKFTNSGQVVLEVQYAGKLGNNIWLDFSVNDTGIGIPKHQLELIFEKFTQADSSTTRKYGGTGLGLAITRQMLRLLNSEISVESVEGQGSRFFFRLQVEAGKAKPAENTVPERVIQSNVIDARILIAEDADINRMIISQYIKDWCKTEPDQATNGKEAVNMAASNRYDLILMDVRMPEMNGYEATRIIKDTAGLSHIPVIALTANTYSDIRKNPESKHFDDVITKPFEPEDLRNKILKHVSSGKNINLTEIQAEQITHKLDFSLVESQFKGNEEKLKFFYRSAHDHLIKYKQQFRHSLKENDVEEFRNMQHNITMLVNLFKLEALNDFLKVVRSLLIDSNSEVEEELIVRGENLFESAIGHLQKKL